MLDTRNESNLVGKPEGKRRLGRPTCRLDYNITINLKEIGQTMMM
jgi:hypothetical protein